MAELTTRAEAEWRGLPASGGARCWYSAGRQKLFAFDGKAWFRQVAAGYWMSVSEVPDDLFLNGGRPNLASALHEVPNLTP